MIQNNHKKILGYLAVRILFLAFYHAALARKKWMNDPLYDSGGNLQQVYGKKPHAVIRRGNRHISVRKWKYEISSRLKK